MAEFHGEGFGKVEDFFGDAAKNGESPSENLSLSNRAGIGRRGVGSGASTNTTLKSTNTTQAVVSKRILQVGKRKDDVNHISSDDDDSNGSDDEELAGRTAIEKPQQERATVEAPKRKSKKGDKKRSKAAESEVSEENILSAETNADIDANEETITAGHQSTKKRKRRKVRSRQKNIYKDKREKKPDHLIPGKSNYQGRPLTWGTREKLGLAPTQQQQLQAHWPASGAEETQPETFESDQTETVPLGESTDALPKDLAPNKKERRKDGAPRKSKYRNLM